MTIGVIVFLFTVDVYAYAVMSNHYHLVLHVDGGRVGDWTDEDVPERLLRLCPPREMRRCGRRSGWITGFSSRRWPGFARILGASPRSGCAWAV